MARKTIVSKIPGDYGEHEEMILVYLYDHPDSIHSTTSLMDVIQPNPTSDDQRKQVFKDTQYAVETLIADGLAKGKRHQGYDGIYYEGLKLTTKGEAEAIRQKRRIKAVVIDPAHRPTRKVTIKMEGV